MVLRRWRGGLLIGSVGEVDAGEFELIEISRASEASKRRQRVAAGVSLREEAFWSSSLEEATGQSGSWPVPAWGSSWIMARMLSCRAALLSPLRGCELGDCVFLGLLPKAICCHRFAAWMGL